MQCARVCTCTCVCAMFVYMYVYVHVHVQRQSDGKQGWVGPLFRVNLSASLRAMGRPTLRCDGDGWNACVCRRENDVTSCVINS